MIEYDVSLTPVTMSSCRNGKELSTGSIATFSVDHKSSKELRQYLANIAEQCEHSATELPTIIVLDNLHHVSSLAEVFNGFLSIKQASRYAIQHIWCMSQARTIWEGCGRKGIWRKTGG